jgi:peptidoglycan hydrolase-like protein with peptidoglycan-binding domain
MKRSGFALLALLLAAGTATMLADQLTSEVQQALKDEGFYYGRITGEKDVDTKAAIRRYQIRNGLQITGEIDAETLRLLGIDPVHPKPQSNATPIEPAPPKEDETPTQSAELNPPPNDTGSFRAPAPAYMVPPQPPLLNEGDIFANTPYEIAPLDVQRHVIVGAQTLLTRQGLYRAGIDGEYGPATAAAVRTFQEQAGLVADGRLNMATLAALGLLPGQRAPGFIPPGRRFPGRPVYRGIWVPDR